MSRDEYNAQSHDATFARMEEQLKSIAETVKAHRGETTAGFERIGARVSALELFRANLKGKVAIISSVIGLGAAGFAEWLKVKFFSGDH